jgi:hypothetical protein
LRSPHGVDGGVDVFAFCSRDLFAGRFVKWIQVFTCDKLAAQVAALPWNDFRKPDNSFTQKHFSVPEDGRFKPHFRVRRRPGSRR